MQMLWLIHSGSSPLPCHYFYFPPCLPSTISLSSRWKKVVHQIHVCVVPTQTRNMSPSPWQVIQARDAAAPPTLARGSSPDGMLNSYHPIIWVCPNHWLSPRLHLQSPTQLLSPTPTEVTWCTASHPSSVPPSFVCAVQRRSCSSAYVRQLWRGPTEAQVLKWQSHLRSYRHFFPPSRVLKVYTSDTFQTGWDSYLITLSATPDMSAARLSVRRLVFIFRTPTVSLFSSVRGDLDSFQTLRATLATPQIWTCDKNTSKTRDNVFIWDL